MTDLGVPRFIAPHGFAGHNTITDRSSDALSVFCGIDWATDHHDVAVVGDDRRVVACGRVGNSAAGFAQLLALLA
jgi:hypothetical protein